MEKRKPVDWSALFEGDDPTPPAKKMFKLFSQRKKPIKQEPVDEPVVVQKAPPQVIEPKTLAEYTLGTEDKIFIDRLTNNSVLADPSIGDLPPMTEVLSYVSRMEDNERPPWFISSRNTVISDGKNYPKLDVLTRAYIAPFLVQCSANERPCCVAPGQCQSEKMGGFRCRELLLPDQLGSPDAIHMQGMCYLCHLANTNALYLEAFNGKGFPEKQVYSIQHFMVQVNIEGEYRLDKTLMGDETFYGIFGPFPVFNVNNYKKIQLNNSTLFAWCESDTMVFHQSPATVESTANTPQAEGKH